VKKLKKLYLKNFGCPLFRDYGTFPPKDRPAGFLADRGRGHGFSGFGGGIADGVIEAVSISLFPKNH